MRRNAEEYWKSISREMESSKNRIRDLIGDVHWQTDGEAKEAVFRKVLSSHISELVRVGRGFVSYPEVDADTSVTSTQIDVLITDKRSPTLFRDGDLAIVTPDAVVAIVEVKTSLNSSAPIFSNGKLNNKSLRGALSKLAIATKEIRRHHPDRSCQAGLFIFESPSQSRIVSEQNHHDLLLALQEASGGDEDKAVNWVAWGTSLFIRYWKAGDLFETVQPPLVSRWHSYDLNELAQGYFLSNLVLETSYNKSEQDTLLKAQGMWFPLEGGKMIYRRFFIALTGGVRDDW